MALIAHIEPTKVAQPGEQSLDLPPALVAAQRAAILCLWPLASPPMRSNQLDALPSEIPIHRVGIIRPVTNQPLRWLVYKTSGNRRRNQDHLVMRSRLGMNGERKTSAVRHCHELRTFAPLGLTDVVPPFFAATNVPSMKHSERSRSPRSLRSSASACNTCSKMPSRTQA